MKHGFSWERNKPVVKPQEPEPCKHGNKWTCGFCMSEAAPKCKHGKPFCCVYCEAEKAPKCSHGNPWYCGYCGPAN